MAGEFCAVTAGASRLNEVALGYRFTSERNNPDEAYGITVNPFKEETVTFGEEDMIIVLAED